MEFGAASSFRVMCHQNGCAENSHRTAASFKQSRALYMVDLILAPLMNTMQRLFRWIRLEYATDGQLNMTDERSWLPPFAISIAQSLSSSFHALPFQIRPSAPENAPPPPLVPPAHVPSSLMNTLSLLLVHPDYHSVKEKTTTQPRRLLVPKDASTLSLMKSPFHHLGEKCKVLTVARS